MDHIVDTIIKLRKMTKPPAPDYIEKNEEIKQAYIKIDKLFIQQYKKLEKIEELVESIPDLTKYSIKIKKQFKEILESK